ncbi:alginate export family protein [Xanthovirga aplysinae]|uniref:alginate export family protein n=1 Tax=Xanthovirga aplysinae TaxID=2529853 RepID=UPI0012BC5521|nr:alginate export family protein [Xanthovirga aplysinae]MTI29674.1 hypothetical protein [Xanthovirga aplysinae]
MKLNYIILITGLILASTSYTWAQGQFTLSGEFRPRTEYNHGTKTLIQEGQKAGLFISQRSRLNLQYLSDRYQFKLVLQDIRTWGSVPQLNTTDGLTSIHEAWADIRFNQAFSLKLGRQEIIYDDHRIFGNVDWAQQARSHDAALLKYKSGDSFQAHFGLAYNQNGMVLVKTPYEVPNSYKAFQYLWLHKDWEQLKASLLFLNNGNEFEDKIVYSQTIGTDINYKADKWLTHVSFYYQGGKDALDQDLNAYMANANLTYLINPAYSIGAGYDLLSGQDQIVSSGEGSIKNKVFTPFYGTNHKFYGFMDYFYVGSPHGNVGLQDAYINLKHKKDKLALGADIHSFFSQASVADLEDASQELDKFMGVEVDLTFGYQIAKDVKLNIGYSQMFGGETLEALKGGDSSKTNNFAWAMLTLKPTFFTQSKKKD